jgi:ABC-2 type transport system ATP-binding protein
MSVLPIEARDLSKTYRVGFTRTRRVNALRELDLSVEPGSVYGLLGPNGAGKSTTIKILLNLVQPTSGRAQLFGRPVSDRTARAHIGFVPENPAPYEYLTGAEFVRLCGRLVGLSGEELDRRADAALGRVGLGRAQGLQIRRYSKGMIQRVALAQALLGDPRLLILDEPTSGLDPVGRREIRDLILETRDHGVTVLFCTHIIPDVEAVCDRVAVLVAGKRVKEGPVRELVGHEESVVEITCAGLGDDRLHQLDIRPERTRDLSDRRVLAFRAAHVDAALRMLLAAGAHIVEVQATRFTLEDLFLKLLADANVPTVGSEISE